MNALLAFLGLRRLRKRHPELFDGEAAQAAVDATVAEEAELYRWADNYYFEGGWREAA